MTALARHAITGLVLSLTCASVALNWLTHSVLVLHIDLTLMAVTAVIWFLWYIRAYENH